MAGSDLPRHFFSNTTNMITKATRTNTRPLIGLYSESGCGKTYTALTLATAFGKTCLVDSESGRGSLYGDVFDYDVLNIEPPFSPAAYIAAIDEVENAGYDIGIIDSASHEWEGAGGILDMACANEERTGKTGLHNWKTPKLEHAKFLLRLLRSKIPWVVCIRAKYKTRQVKENGKTVIVQDSDVSPIQAEDFIFEMTAHGQIDSQHGFHITKCSHPALRECFNDGKPITKETGVKLRQWCFSGVAASQPASAPVDEVKSLKAQIWTICQKSGCKTVGEAEGMLRLKSILGEAETLKDLDSEHLKFVLERLK